MKAKWWHSLMLTPRELRSMGVLGINMRNARYLSPNNPRRYYQRVDDKILTKELAKANGLAVPESFLILESPHEVRTLVENLSGHDSFVIKPARGSGGRGVLVVDHCDRGFFVKPSGARLCGEDLRNHASNILAGLHSLGGNRDCAMVEYRVTTAQAFRGISFQGAPDIRIVLLHGYPVLAMLRAATSESDGRANLHQGALGVGIDLATGVTTRAVHRGKIIFRHPDLDAPLAGLQVPEWDKILEIAGTCYDMTGMGYLGVDLMVDETRGPLMIEVNARPGLAIQMACGIGLQPRLEAALARRNERPGESARERLDFCRLHFASNAP